MLTRRSVITALLSGRFSATRLTRLEFIANKSGGRLGCAILDTESGERTDLHANDRFPMCSTFKFLAGAFVLSRIDKGVEQLNRRISFSTKDLVAYSPATELHAGHEGMTVADLCHAAMTLSDNTAANLLLASFGGPAALTAFARSIGDPVTRLDRIEPGLNEGKEGDPRDTTTPAAMVANLKTLLLGSALSKASRGLLTQWMVDNKTGDARLRAGLPARWRTGDKTGSGESIANDIAILWPPNRAPLVVAAYLTQGRGSADDRSAVLAEIGRIIAG